MPVLDPAIRALAQGPNYATITAMLSSGRMMTQIMWVDADDDHILMNTEAGRAKYVALEADPRATVMVWDHNDVMHYGEVRGRVVDIVRGDRARAHIDELSMKYRGEPYDGRWIGTERVILKIAPETQREQKV